MGAGNSAVVAGIKEGTLNDGYMCSYDGDEVPLPGFFTIAASRHSATPCSMSVLSTRLYGTSVDMEA